MTTFKASLIAFFLILCCSSLLAQNTIMQRLDSVITVGKNEKTEYFYDEYGHNKSLISYKWSNTLMAWETVSKMDFSYNSKGLCISELTYLGKQLGLVSKTDKIYDENNQLLQTNLYIPNADKWELNTKTDYTNTYDSKNNLTSSILFKNQINSAEVRTKYEFSYNSSGNLLTVLYYTWTGYWVNNYKEEFILDAQANITGVNKYSWVSSTWKLFSDNNYQINDDKNFSIDKVVHPIEYIKVDNMLPIGFRVKYLITSCQENSQLWTKRYYYSSMVLTGSNDKESLSANIYPNPATDFINIQWTGNQQIMNIELYDITGRKLLNERIENNSRLSLTGFHKGVYLMNILDDDKITHSQKIYLK